MDQPFEWEPDSLHQVNSEVSHLNRREDFLFQTMENNSKRILEIMRAAFPIMDWISMLWWWKTLRDDYSCLIASWAPFPLTPLLCFLATSPLMWLYTAKLWEHPCLHSDFRGDPREPQDWGRGPLQILWGQCQTNKWSSHCLEPWGQDYCPTGLKDDKIIIKT